MSTAKDVTDLRKAGQLNAAYELGVELLAVEPDNIWTKRAMGWVRYDRLKAAAKGPSLSIFIDEWQAINALVANAPADETMLTNNAAWQAVSRLFNVGERDEVNGLLEIVFHSLQHWVLERPSELYSALLKAFLKAGKNWPGLNAFLSWWNLQHLRPEDYLPTIFADGKKGIALAEQAYISKAKQLLLHPEPLAIKELIGQLEVLTEQHPEYQYPPYYQAKLLATGGSKQEALVAVMPFARRKQREFWMWDLLANLYGDEPEKAIACLCKAVTTPTQEKFLVNARLTLAKLLKQQGLLSESYTELDKVVKTRKAEGWAISSVYTDELASLQKNGAVLQPDRKKFYSRYLPLTDELLYADVPEQIGVVTHLNTDKRVAHFVISRTVTGHFKYDGRLSLVQPGDLVALRLEERTGKDGNYWMPLSARTTTQSPSDEIFKLYEGSLKRLDGKGFGFVTDVFIAPDLLKSLVSEESPTISGKAVLSFDKVKQMHKWKAVTAVYKPQ